ncbi:MAG TPA: tetratricopeptide repeat protein [bacterium]|nr:tetratricopeptide repeat protein [bacterium]
MRIDIKVLYFVSVFLILFVILSGCKSAEPKIVSDESKADSYYQLGLAALNQGEYVRAKREITRAIETAPDIPHYYNHLGIVYFQENDYKKAEEMYRKALELDERYSDAYNNLGALHIKTGDYEKAIEYFDIVSEDPLYPYPHYVQANLGIVKRLQKKYDEAEKHLLNSIRLKGTHCEAYKELAILYDEQSLHEKAAKNYDSTIKFCPYHVEALYRGAVKAYMLKKESVGEKYLKRCLEVDFTNVKRIQIPFLDDCVDLANQVGVTYSPEKEGSRGGEKRQIDAN